MIGRNPGKRPRVHVTSNQMEKRNNQFAEAMPRDVLREAAMWSLAIASPVEGGLHAGKRLWASAVSLTC